MAVRYGQQFLGSLGQPLVARCRLAVWRVAIAAGVISDRLVRAMIALFDMPAQGSSTAGADVAESFSLLWGDGVSPAFEKSFSVLTEDIGHFEPMFPHLLLPSPLEARISRIGRSSSGLTVARNLASETRR